MASITVGPKQVVIELPGPLDAEVTRHLIDSAYLTSIIKRAWVEVGNSVDGDRLLRPDGAEEPLAQWIAYATTPDIYSDGFVRIGMNDYLKTRMTPGNDGTASPTLGDSLFGAPIKSILGKPEDFGLGGEDPNVTYEKAVPLFQKALTGITAQCGLLEDDILYNLALLCTNVLEPLKAKYPNMIVVSGFRQMNTNISQHERGEAADVQLRNQTPELLYEVADYIAKSLQFDQLVLNYTNSGRSWIHVSFSAESLRREVLTRDLNDEFHTGLFLITPLVGEERAAAERDAQESLSTIQGMLDKETARESRRMSQQTVSGDPIVKDTTSGVELTPDKLSIVRRVWATRTPTQWGFDPTGAAATETYPYSSAAGRFVEAVVEELRKDITSGTAFGTLTLLVGRTYNQHEVDRIGYAQIIRNDAGLPVQTGLIVPIVILENANTADAAPVWLPQDPIVSTETWTDPENPVPQPF